MKIEELDTDCVFNIAARGYFSYRQRKEMAEKNNIDMNAAFKQELEIREQYVQNPEAFVKIFLKSPRLTYQYCENRRKRLSPELEKEFIANCNKATKKGTTPYKKYYYEYCRLFNIVVSAEDILLEVAFGEDDKKRTITNYRSGKNYLLKMAQERKKCLDFINQLLEVKNISKENTIGDLLEELSK